MGQDELEVVCRALAETQKPHMLCKDCAGDLWEFISYPFIEDGALLQYVRVPGDPTSMIAVHAFLMQPENQSCFCHEAEKFLGKPDLYLSPDYYRKREARLTECPAFVKAACKRR